MLDVGNLEMPRRFLQNICNRQGVHSLENSKSLKTNANVAIAKLASEPGSSLD